MTQEIATIHPGSMTSYALPLEEMKAQVNLIQHVMRDVMKVGEHYGKIPGCGDKPTLLKPGAEKIMMTFRLANDTEIDAIEMPRGHREYRVKVTLFSPVGQRLGTGVGSCSTMEGKYRYRVGGGELTDIIIPKSYWDMKKENPGGAAKLLKELANKAGVDGDKFGSKKNESGAWVVTTFGDKVEHDNPADYYNTVLKMAKKRALVDAVLTTTAASDIFTQDVEDMPEVIPGAKESTKAQPQQEPAKQATKKVESIMYMAETQRSIITDLLAVKDVPLDTLKKVMVDFNGNPTVETAQNIIDYLSKRPEKQPVDVEGELPF